MAEQDKTPQANPLDAPKAPERAIPAPPPVPAINPNNVALNVSGMVFQSYFVRLPEGVTAQHLNDDPSIWRRVQSIRNVALRKFDEVRIVDFDERWMADATVSFADDLKVILAKPRITQLPERTVAVFEDETYRVKWLGSGWGVERKKDGQLMCGGQAFGTAGIAQSALRQLYPRRTAV